MFCIYTATEDKRVPVSADKSCWLLTGLVTEVGDFSPGSDTEGTVGEGAGTFKDVWGINA